MSGITSVGLQIKLKWITGLIQVNKRCWFFKQNSTNQWPAVPGSEEPWVATFQASQMNSNFTASSNVSDDTWVRWGQGWKLERKSTTMFNSTFCSSYRIIEEVETSFHIQAKNFIAIIFTLPCVLVFVLFCIAICICWKPKSRDHISV